MNYQQEWADDFDEESGAGPADRSDPEGGGDPEDAVPEGEAPDEADPADVAEQLIEIPVDEDDEAPA